MGFRVQGLEFGFLGFGIRESGVGFGVECSGFGAQDLGFGCSATGAGDRQDGRYTSVAWQEVAKGVGFAVCVDTASP